MSQRLGTLACVFAIGILHQGCRSRTQAPPPSPQPYWPMPPAQPYPGPPYPGQPQAGPPPYAPPPTPGAGAPCAAEGGYDCTPDRRALTICRRGRTAIASTCRGARGCSVAAAVDCDHSVAVIGDPCEGPKEIGCSQDGKSMLRCTNGVYQFGEACRNACLSTSGRVLCQ